MRKIIPAILVIALVAALAGCASAVGSGYGQGGLNGDGRSYSDARDDNTITAKVNTLLVRDQDIPAMNIDVSTLNGVVSINGTVPTHALAERAARLAASVDGVKNVLNHLRVAP